MSEPIKKPEVDSTPHVSAPQMPRTRREKDILREQLAADMAEWIAAGNVVDDRGESDNNSDYNPVYVHLPAYQG